MATFLAHITITPGREAEFESIARELHRASHASEEQLVRYEYWRGAAESTYYCLASFPDHHAFLGHQASDHHENASPALRDVIETIRLEWVDPMAGASPLAPTDHQDAPEDADERTAQYARSYAADVQDWWQALRQR